MSHSRPRKRHPILIAWLLCLLAAPAAAGPHSPDDGCLTDSVCRGHYNQAVKLFEGGRFEPALVEFQSAYRRRQMPWLLINIGRTLHRLGRPREALEYYDRHRQAEAKPDAETLDRLEKYTAQARALADTNPTTPPPETPPDPPLTTEPAAAPGAAAAPGTAAAPPAAVTPAAATPPAIATAPTPPQPEHKPVYKKWWFWTAIGGGVAAIAVIGIVAGVAANSSPGLPSGVTTITFKL
jgi:hypothetical protein